MNIKHKYLLALILITLLAFFLRFFKFYPNLVFNGEMGTDYMNIWNTIHGSRSWLIGPRTSHEWFFISPISYWIYTVLFLIWNYNPVVINVFWGVVGSFAVLVCYFALKKLFNQNVALISSFLLAVSPAWITQTRASRYNLIVSILFFPYLLLLRNSIKDKGRSLFKLGLILGLMMSFFPSPILLVPAVIVSFVFYHVRPKFKYILYSILGFLIPNITFLVYEVKDHFSIVIKMISWVPYRILGFFGIYQKNTADAVTVTQNLESIYKFFSKSLIGQTNIFSLAVFVLVVALTLFVIWKDYKNKKEKISFFLLFVNLIVCYFGLFIHGNPPEHYYYVIFPIPLVLSAYFFDKFIKKRFLQISLVLLFGLISIFSLAKANWFYTDRMPFDYTITTVPYKTQLRLVDSIVRDSQGSEISLERVGMNDEFENDFANNYIYLLTIKGTKLSSNAKLKYTIVEEENYLTPSGRQIFSEKGVFVYKTEL